MRFTREGAELPKTPAVMSAVRRDLVVAPFSPQNPYPRTFRVFRESPDAVVVPSHWARATFPGMHIKDARGDGERARMTFVGELNAQLHQPQAAEAVLRQWDRCGGAMLCLPPGYGKTVTTIYLACQLGKKALVVVHKDFLAQQWEERIRQYAPGATVSRVQGPTCDTSGDFVIAMLQTLISREYPPSTFSPCALLIVDESHHIAAAAFSQAMWGLHMPYTLGLTATPDRRDRLGRVVEWFLGGIAFQVRRQHQAGTRVIVQKYSCPRYHEPPPVNRRGNVCFTSVITQLAEDPERTRAIARAACDLAHEGHDVLVLSHRRKHCADICELVREAGYGCATYLGGDKAVPTTRVVVATYHLTSEGFDCPRLTALVLATPSSDVEQSCGRVMRGTSDTNAVIVDLVDAWGVCFAQHAKRKAFYTRCGFDVRHASEAHATPDAHACLDTYAFME